MKKRRDEQSGGTPDLIMSLLTLWPPKEASSYDVDDIQRPNGSIGTAWSCDRSRRQGLTRSEAKRPVSAPPHFFAALRMACCCLRSLSSPDEGIVSAAGGGNRFSAVSRKRSNRLLTRPRSRVFSAARSFMFMTAGALRPPKRRRHR